MNPRFEFGDSVRLIRNVRNDGTYPGKEIGELLIRRGSIGVVRDVGSYLQDQVIYTVHYLEADKIVGCREEELLYADEPWTPSKYEVRERVRSRVTLAVAGEIRTSPGVEGEIMKVIRDLPGGVQYHVHFPGWVLQVPESAIDPITANTEAEPAATEEAP
jgi:nitrogen fixation protein NifZ